MRTLILIFGLFAAWTVHAQAVDKSNEHVYSPTYTFALVDIPQFLSVYLNPDGPHFTFRDTGPMRPDVEATRRNMSAIYEIIVARTNAPNFPGHATRDLNIDDLGRIMTSWLVDMYYPYNSLLLVLGKKDLSNHFGEELFFANPIAEEESRRKSVAGMTSASHRASALLIRLVESFKAEIDAHEKTLTRLIDRVRPENDEAAQLELKKEVKQILYDIRVLKARMEYVVHKLAKASKYANQFVLQRGRVTRADLEERMALLGQGLNSALNAIETFREGERNPANLKFPGIKLVDPFKDLPNHLGEAIPEFILKMRPKYEPEDPAPKYEAYREAVLVQYVLAAGSIMSKILDTPEGRGSLSQRLRGEIRYRLAQTKRESEPMASETQSTSLALPLKDEAGFRTALSRHSFADPALIKKRDEMENRLWSHFFEHANLNPVDCAKALAGHVKVIEPKGDVESAAPESDENAAR